MKFLADEGVDRPIVTLLRQSGFEVQYILELCPGADDDTVLDMANQTSSILITQDKDFGELVFRLKKLHSGIVLIRLGNAPSLIQAEIVNHVIQQHQSKISQAFTVIQPKTVRIRRELSN
ncbi:DUF5615 family PIN-like protein [Chitinophaga vietnamensis]|uniref:DUF5615 family PIN-like protein n=1 Tax=Chitinophaga vietnamensis TaxID=2593957 RepID=UPI0011786C79|nr:DUF5615 family PIN-like protein [Chitinophaga vietnamensis]